ncbi:carboxymuconolactone decarboxylase family protein [Rhodococcus rhodnii]|uniref:Carboxymuconolactone decarboxylase family protein n=1 Tax=Rhodococcus rhodnii TaxID=38312 RepID=A0A6P2C890_9NOCA|nr:carboxymuconolactone decarboxylase family protein [Rhodococcus rhodnii]TXG88954.1 carboxymuconolactone decarboxylase family protein [Rhodococcus rhodnii]
MTPRIPALAPAEAGPVGRLLYRVARRRYGEVPEPFSVLARHRRLLVAAGVAEFAAEKASTVLPGAVRELAVYRVAWTLGCSWCVDFGTMLQRLDRLDVGRLEHIADYATSPLYSDDERAAIAYADAMTATPTTVTDDQVEDLRRRFGDAGTLELTHQIGLENQRARQNTALGITDQGFSTDSCRVPWVNAES